MEEAVPAGAAGRRFPPPTTTGVFLAVGWAVEEVVVVGAAGFMGGRGPGVPLLFLLACFATCAAVLFLKRAVVIRPRDEGGGCT